MIKSWSPSRLEKYEQCPRKAKYEIVDKLCPKCFEGRVLGGFDSPAICDACGEEITKGEALERGTDIGNRLDAHLTGSAKVPPEVRHPTCLKVIKEAKAAVKKGPGKIQLDLIFDKDWKLLKKTGDFAPKGYWAWFKLDLVIIGASVARVVDWKTGGIDKKTGAVRAEAKYDDQLRGYTCAALSAFPAMEAATAELVFLDCGPRFEPIVKRAECDLARKDLAKEQAHWTKKVKAMLSDRVFAPKANEKCKWCDFSKAKGGPCPY